MGEKMLRTMKRLHGLTVMGTEGALGKIKDFGFDDATWQVRYIVVDTGGWFSSHKLLIDSDAPTRLDWSGACLYVDRTRQQVEHDAPNGKVSAPPSQATPVHARNVYSYYREDTLLRGMESTSALAAAPIQPALIPMPEGTQHRRAESASPLPRDCRAARDVVGYAVHAEDGHVGRLKDFLVDDEEWSIRAIEISFGKRLPGKHVLIPIGRILKIDRHHRSVRVSGSREQFAHWTSACRPTRRGLRMQRAADARERSAARR